MEFTRQRPFLTPPPRQCRQICLRQLPIPLDWVGISRWTATCQFQSLRTGAMKNIVLIDDDYASEILVEAIAARGYAVQRISSASDALQEVDTIARADLVILDIIMERPAELPGIRGARTTGLGILTAIRAKNASLPIVVFSGTADRIVLDAVSGLPNTKFLSKWNNPSLKELFQIIDDLLQTSRDQIGPFVFIVHGHDDAEKLAVKNYLQNNLGFPEPIILHEKPNLGRTIIEKLEDYTGQIDVCVVILTPDDKMADPTEGDNAKRRARQNVIFELGYFMGVFGRTSGKVILLHKGELDLPSDIRGLLYIDISNGILAAGEMIRKELSDVIGS